jgi:hypothetical protein
MMRSRKTTGVWKIHKWNYIPIKGMVIPTPVTKINNPEKLAQQVFITAGVGDWILKGFTYCTWSKLKIKNFTLAEITLEPAGDSYKMTRFVPKGISHYFFWKKSDEWIRRKIQTEEEKTKN